MTTLSLMWSEDLGFLNNNGIAEAIIKRGEKWRMPSLEELLVAFQNKVPGFSPVEYRAANAVGETKPMKIVSVDMGDGMTHSSRTTVSEEHAGFKMRVRLVAASLD